MSREQAAEIIKTIKARGFRAYLVGGCVRDVLMGRTPEDWDIASSARPEQIMEIFGEKAIPTGLRHGTVTVKARDGLYEITTFRTEGTYSDGRHPDTVSYSSSIEEDLSRRDLTINAMAMDDDGRVIDPFGGQKDLALRRIRCVGDPRKRFEEDALRILRAIRFASVLQFAVDPATVEAVHARAGLLKRIAAERILAEMNKLLCGSGCREVLLDYPDVLGVFLPELLPCVGFDQQNIHHCFDLYTHIVYATAAIRNDPILRWVMLLHDIGKVDTFTVDAAGQGHFYGHPDRSAAMSGEICTRMRMRKKDRENIVTLICWHDRNIHVTEQGIGRALLTLGEENFRRLLEVKRADNLAQAPEFHYVGSMLDEAEALLEDILRKKRCLQIRDLDVDGNDLLALGYSGREIGQALHALLQRVAAGEMANERTALLAALQERGPLLP